MSGDFEGSFKRPRLGERPQAWSRIDRIAETAPGWYVRTREGINIGPFSSQFQAEIEASMLVAKLARAGAAAGVASEIIRKHQVEALLAASGAFPQPQSQPQPLAEQRC